MPGGKPQERKTSGILLYSEPDGRRVWYGVTPCDLAKPRIAPHKNTWETTSKIRFLVQFEAHSREKGMQFYQTRSHAVVLYNTLPAACIEKAVCMNTQDELYQKYRSTPRVSRVVLKSNSQYGQQDPQSQDARSCWEPSSDSKSYGEICNNTVDHRIPGVPLSAVEQQNTKRENKVEKLIEKFENHKNKKIIHSGLEPDAEDQQVQQRIARLDRRHEQHRDLRTLRKFFQTAMSWLQCQLGNGNNLLQLWKKYEIYAESNGVRPEQPWRHLNPWMRDQEEQQSWSQARSSWRTKDVLPCETDA